MQGNAHSTIRPVFLVHQIEVVTCDAELSVVHAICGLSRLFHHQRT